MERAAEYAGFLTGWVISVLLVGFFLMILLGSFGVPAGFLACLTAWIVIDLGSRAFLGVLRSVTR